MSKASPAIWMALSLVSLAASACDRRADSGPAPAAAPAAAVAPVSVTPAPAAAVDPLARPVGADEVDLALAGAQAFNAKSAAELANITRSETRIKALAAKVTASVAGGGGGESQRRALSASIQSARTETETLHSALTADAAAFRLASTASLQALEASLAQCSASVELAAYPACATLTSEQTALTLAITALGRRYDAAETTYRQERTRLEEASAIIALGSDGAGQR